jgi:hypothetical protein
VIAAFLPRSVRRRQIHEWHDQLDCTRATDGDPRRELLQVVRSAPSIAWIAVPSFLRVSLPPLAVAMMAALALWPGGTPPLVDQKLGALAETARIYTPFLADVVRSNGSDEQIDRIVSQVSERANARVTMLGVGDGTEGVQLAVFSDSMSETQALDLHFASALTAATAEHPTTGTESSDHVEFGQAAVPISDYGTVSRIAVFSTPMSDVQAKMALIRRQIFIAGALGLLLGLGGAFIVLGSMSSRVGLRE